MTDQDVQEEVMGKLYIDELIAMNGLPDTYIMPDCSACNEYQRSKTAIFCPKHELEALQNHICTECGGMLVDYPMATSPDDYDMGAVCNGCGATYTP